MWRHVTALIYDSNLAGKIQYVLLSTCTPALIANVILCLGEVLKSRLHPMMSQSFFVFPLHSFWILNWSSLQQKMDSFFFRLLFVLPSKHHQDARKSKKVMRCENTYIRISSRGFQLKMEGFDWATCHKVPHGLRGAAIASRVALEGYLNAHFLRLHRNGGHAACRLSTRGPKAGGGPVEATSGE